MRCNPQIWFGQRELDHIPPHFVKCPTPLTSEALLWVNTTLIGRFAVSTLTDGTTILLRLEQPLTIYFEDPAEAMVYELRWAGSK